MSKIADVVKLRTGYANFVQLKSAFHEDQENAERMAMYRPTAAHRKAFERLCRGLYTPNDKKFYLLSGSYGTGKSHLCLMFANFLSRSSGEPEIKGFYDNYKKLDAENAKMLANVRKSGQYLVAICDYHAAKHFEDVVLKAVFDACKEKGLDAGVETEFDEAERLLSDWEAKSKDTKAIRNYYADFAKALEKVAPGLSAKQLRAKLKAYDSEALSQFHAAYKEAQGGTPFQAQAGNLIPILQKLVRSEAFKERFKGLAILFDEFGFTLEKAAYSKDILQGFMETICKNEPNILFVGCIHKDFKAYADRFSKEDVAVMDARKTQVDLLNEGIEEIIGAIVETEKNSDTWKQEVAPKTGVFDQLLSPCETLKLFPWITDVKRIRQRVLEDIYGVHPVALSCLLKLSSEIGSDARSTFTFFSGAVGGADGSYADFINSADIAVNGGKLRLYTVDELFSFFKRELSLKNTDLRDRQRQLVNGFVASMEALRKAAKQDLVDEQADERAAILKAILIYQLCQIPTTLENIQFGQYCLTTSESKQVENHLKYLEKSGAAFLRKQSKTYELTSSSGDDPYELVERYLATPALHPPDLVEAFLKEAEDQDDLVFLEAKGFNLPFVDDKRFKRYFVRAKDLGDTLWKNIRKGWETAKAQPADAYEGALVYALCEDEAEVNLAKQAVADIPDANIAVAMPHEPIPFTDTILRVKACRHYLPPSDAEKITAQTESRLRDILENPDDGYLPSLQHTLRAITDSDGACWYGQGGKVLHDKPQQPHKPADALCETLFTKRCRVKHPDLNYVHDNKWETGKNIALKQAVEVLLGAEKVIIDNGNPDNHGQKRYLEKVLLKAAGALKKTGSDGTVSFFECESEPGKISADFPALKELCQRVVQLKPGASLSIGAFVQEAMAPPYGAGGTSITLALAHVICALGERLRIYKDSTKTTEISLDSYDTLADLVADPSTKVVFEVRDITVPQAKLVEGISKAVGAAPLKHGEKRSLSDAYEAVQKCWQAVPAVAKILDLYDKDRRARLKPLIKVLNDAANADRFDLILNQIPVVYTGDPAAETIKDKEVTQICDDFTADVKLLSSGHLLARTQVADAVSALFGSKGDLVQCEATVAEWYQALTPAQRDPLRFEKEQEAESLLKELADDARTFESKLTVALPQSFGFDPLKDWTALQTVAYAAKWKQAKMDIEEAAVVIPAPVVTKKTKATEVGANHWRLDAVGTLEVEVPNKATAIIYTTDGQDPKKSADRKTSKSTLALHELLDDKPTITVTARATDDQANVSPIVKFTLFNKQKEYEITVDKKDLYLEEGYFKVPEAKDDLLCVLKSTIGLAVIRKVITKEQAEKIAKFLDQALN